MVKIMKKVKKGIVFIGGEGPLPHQCRYFATGADFVVAADSGLVLAENAGIYPNRIVGDMDSLDTVERLQKYPAEHIIRYPVDKDYTDTELALTLLHDYGCDNIVILGGGGGRVDHLFAIRALFEREPAPDQWVTAAEIMYGLAAPQELSLQLDAGTVVSVFPLGSGPWRAESKGLRWSLNNLLWRHDFFSISNVAEGSISIHALVGTFLVIIPL
jgi:thiamine pyrophosphokinase